MEDVGVPSNWTNRFSPKERRVNFLRQRTAAHLAMQIRALRATRDWSQDDLAAHSGVTQPAISRCERVGYGKQTISTLLKLAEAFDVGLDVSFVSFGELWRRERKLATSQLVPLSFAEEVEARSKRGLAAKIVELSQWKSSHTVETAPPEKYEIDEGQLFLPVISDYAREIQMETGATYAADAYAI